MRWSSRIPADGGGEVLGTLAVSFTVAASVAVAPDALTATPPATAGSDYTATTGTLTFTAGETGKTVEVTVLDYNHVKPHGSLRTKRDNRVTPAMAAGIADRPATLEALVELIDARAPKVQYAKTYKKRQPAVSN